jgi:hypothetical protein
LWVERKILNVAKKFANYFLKLKIFFCNNFYNFDIFDTLKTHHPLFKHSPNTPTPQLKLNLNAME